MTEIKHIATFKPFPWQVKAWTDMNFLQLYSGSAGGGKSKFCAEKIHALMLRYPNSTGLVLRKTKESMRNSTLLQLEGVMGLPHVKNVVHKRQDNRFEYSNGSILAYGGMKDDKQKEGIRSVGKDGSVDFVWMEEATAFREEDFNEVTARMRGRAAPFRCIMMSTNPDAPTHWINRRMILKKEASCYFSSCKDNPINPPEYVEALNSLTGLEGKRLRDGIWCQAEGVIYDMFDMDNVVDDSFCLPYPSNYKDIFGGADSNYPKPRAGVLVVQKGEDLLVIDEFYQTGAHVEQMCKWFEEKSVIYEKPITVYHDPSDPDAITRINNYQRLRGEKANNKVQPGITEVSTLFAKKKLFIHERCINLIQEIQSYRWKKNGEEPEKENDHAVDALRYAIMSFNSGEKLGEFDYAFI